MKKGISLVALIITIIVLIILTAAVIMSEEGTWEISELAVFKNDVSTVQEAVTTKILNNSIYAAVNVKNAETYKWVGVAEDYIYDETTGPTFNVVINGISTVKLSEAIKENINISDTELSQYYVDNKGIIYYYDVTTQKGFEYEGITYYNATMTNQTTINTASGTTLGDLVDASMYGARVFGYTAGGVSNWKIFYKQTVEGEEYVYLIASDILSAEQIPNITGVTILSSSFFDCEGIYWESIPESQPMNSNNLFMANWGDYSTNDNAKCVSALLNTSNWSVFATPTNTNLASYVKGAIGSPTAEMFAASWTANGGTSLSMTDTMADEVSSYGYYYNYDGLVDQMGAMYSIDDSNYGEYPRPGNADVDLYYCLESGNNVAYYLASPFGGDSGMMCCVVSSTDYGTAGCSAGFIHNERYGLGVRPVVCIKATIPASVFEGVITIVQ